MFELDEEAQERVTHRFIARLERDRKALRDMMQGNIPYATYNALMHAIWRIDKELKEYRESLIPRLRKFEVQVKEVHTYELVIEAESVEQAEAIGLDRWDSGALTGGLGVTATASEMK